MRKLNALIAGSTGYIGVQLIKILTKHKNVNIKYLCGNTSVGKKFSFFESSLKLKRLPKITKYQKKYLENVDIIKQSTDYDVRCSVSGGGPTGQAGALVHGISKALLMFDESFKTTLKTEKLTTRDSRAVERKKPGRKKARRSFQFSKR